MRREIQSFLAYLFLYHFVYILKNSVHEPGGSSVSYTNKNLADVIVYAKWEENARRYPNTEPFLGSYCGRYMPKTL